MRMSFLISSRDVVYEYLADSVLKMNWMNWWKLGFSTVKDTRSIRYRCLRVLIAVYDKIFS